MSNRDNAEQRSFLDDEHQEALMRNLTKRLAEVEAALHALETWQRHASGLLDGPFTDRLDALEAWQQSAVRLGENHTDRIDHLSTNIFGPGSATAA